MKIFVFFSIIFSLFLSQVSANSEVEDFYSTSIVETAGGYIDDEITTLGLLYEVKKLLQKKYFENPEYSQEKVLELMRINQQNINTQLQILDRNQNNIEIVTQYFQNKNSSYIPYIEVIKNSGKLNAPLKDSQSTLFEEILNQGNISDIIFALDRGIDPNLIDIEGNVAFYSFLQSGGIKFGPNYPERNLRNTTDYAKTQEISQIILERGFQPEIIDNNGKNLLFYLIDMKSIPLIEGIIQFHKNLLNNTDNQGNNAVFYAIKNNFSEDILSVLLDKEYFIADQLDAEKNNLLHISAGTSNEIYQKIISKNIDVNQKNQYGKTPLIALIESSDDQKNIEEKYLVLQQTKRLDINIIDNKAQNALFSAIEKNFFDTAKRLIEDGINVRQVNRTLQNILSFAVEKNVDIEIIDTILALDINKNQQDINKNTALHLLLASPIDYQRIETLLEGGVNPNILNNEDTSIITHMIETSDYALLEILKPYRLNLNQILKSGENQPSIFLYAVKKGDIAFLSSVLEYKKLFEIDTTQKDILGNTALHIANQQNNYGLTKLLLTHNVPLNERNNQGNTPLIDATIRNHFNIVHLLSYSEGIDFEKQNEENMNVFDFACKNNSLNIRLLLQKAHKNFSTNSCK